MDSTAADFSRGVAFTEGNYVPVAEASISVLDWGFLHSDATYDVAHVWRGRFFRIDEYLDRFHASMTRLRMSIPYSREQVKEIIDQLKANGAVTGGA